MARFVIVILALALAAFVAFGAANAVRGALRAGRDRIETAQETGSGTMQKLSFVLLCALIFYVAIWGNT